MDKQNFIYVTDNDYKEIFADDVLTSFVNGDARLAFINTSLPLPKSSQVINNEMTLQIDNPDVLVKHIKGNVIVPLSLIPNIINSLQTTYNQAIELENKNKEA